MGLTKYRCWSVARSFSALFSISDGPLDCGPDEWDRPRRKMGKTFPGSNCGYRSGENSEGQRILVDWKEGRPVIEWTKGRGGLEQEDWATYYARSCSPAIGYCLDAGGCQIDWSEPGMSHSLTKKYPQPATGRLSELLMILRAFSSSEPSISVIVSRPRCWVADVVGRGCSGVVLLGCVVRSIASYPPPRLRRRRSPQRVL